MRQTVLDFAAPAEADKLAVMKGCGVDGVVRYLCDPRDTTQNWKRLTQHEVERIHKAKLDLYFVFQNANNHIDYFTEAQGRQDGEDARHLLELYGAPQGLPVFFAVDFGASLSELENLIVHYFNGVYESLLWWKVGIYGGYDTVRFAQRHWAGVNYYWQTVAWSPRAMWAPNNAPIELPGVHLFQHDTGAFASPEKIDKFQHDVDLNVAYISGWNPSGSAHKHRAEIVLR